MKHYLLDCLNNLNMQSGIFCTTDVIVAEYTAGLTPEQQNKVLPFIYALKFLPSSRTIAVRAGNLYYDLYRKGKTTPLIDCFVAAVARYYNAIVVTRDRKHFANLANAAQIKFV